MLAHPPISGYTLPIAHDSEHDMSYRIIIAAITGLILIGLLAWQEHRWQLVRACTDDGGAWDGANSKCRSFPVRLLIEKDLNRS